MKIEQMMVRLMYQMNSILFKRKGAMMYGNFVENIFHKNRLVRATNRRRLKVYRSGNIVQNIRNRSEISGFKALRESNWLGNR